MDPTRLADAIAFARRSESDWPASLYTPEGEFIGCAYVNDPPPYNKPLGPVQPRGGASGLIVHRGRLVGQWGNIHEPDMTFSVAKSVLALLTGLAVDDGMIGEVDQPVWETLPSSDAALAHFDSAQNRAVTWRHLLEQTSEWEGSLWDRPDTVDSNRQTDAGSTVDNRLKGTFRPRQAPGQFWEYNDVRVNLLSRCLLSLFRQPLATVLKDRIMEPIGASETWNWLAYRNALVDIDGRPVPSVPGGGHWGGGLIVSALDLARIGYLTLRGGAWTEGKSLIGPAWIDALRRPSALNPNYSLLWWLNTGGKTCATAPESCFFMAGGGVHIVWIDDENDLLIVARWAAKEHAGTLIGMITSAISTTG